MANAILPKLDDDENDRARVRLRPAPAPRLARQLPARPDDGPAILALDLGQHTGWTLSADGLITSGTVQFRPGRFESAGMVFLRFGRWLDEVHHLTGGIDELVFEEVRAHRGTAAAHWYGGLLAHLSAWAETREVPYRGVPVGTIKRHVTGKGNADKAAVLAAVRALGHQPADDNEADALALLLWALAQGGGGGR